MNPQEKKDYGKYVKKHAPPSPVLRNFAAAFWVGGAVCTVGQLLFYLYSYCGADEKTALTLVSVSLIFVAALLTGLGIFDDIARYAGAGTLVPITGFANAVAAPALDNKKEGLVLGEGAKIFAVAGPVLLFGILSGALYGVILWVVSLF